jgi:hypothetical protein
MIVVRLAQTMGRKAKLFHRAGLHPCADTCCSIRGMLHFALMTWPFAIACPLPLGATEMIKNASRNSSDEHRWRYVSRNEVAVTPFGGILSSAECR